MKTRFTSWLAANWREDKFAIIGIAVILVASLFFAVAPSIGFNWFLGTPFVGTP